MEFNSAPPTVMHVDINSCFATIEQQANPRLRGKPTVVAAYVEPHGCILAASREAKAIGIGTGMRVREAQSRCPYVIVLAPDPDKYRFMNRQLKALLGSYTPHLSVESIDEMVLDLAGTPALRRFSQDVTLEHTRNPQNTVEDDTQTAMKRIGQEIKQRIRAEIGEWMTVSIGIAPNRYLAKVASGLHKPDGLDMITKDTIEPIFSRMRLEQLCGIKNGNADRLRLVGITTPIAFFRADPARLAHGFRSIMGYHWYQRLHGYEDGTMYKAFGSHEGEQKSFGQSHALGTPLFPQDPELWKILSQLTLKMARRLRADGFTAQGIGISTLFSYTDSWHTQERQHTSLFADGDFYTRMQRLLQLAPQKPVRILAVYCYQLHHDLYTQQSLLEQDNKKERLTKAIDAVSDKWGEYAITPARMLAMHGKVLDRISFGRIRQLNKPV